MSDHDTTPHVHDLARAVAAHLPGWSVDTPYDHGASLVDPDGVRIHVRVGTYGRESGRLLMSGGYPDGASYADGDTHGVESGSITAAVDRDPAAVAREVTRRLHPTAVAAWREVSGRIERRKGRAAARDALARDLAAALGGRFVDWRNEPRAELPDRVRGYGHLTPDYDSLSVTVELRHVPAELALELARHLATWPDKADA